MTEHAIINLQTADTRIDQLTHRLTSSDEQTNAEAAAATFESLNARSTELTEQINKLRASEKLHETEAATLNERIATLTNQQNNATGDVAKEVAALQHEIDQARSRLDDIDNETLQLIESIEALEKDTTETETELANARSVLDEADKALNALRGELASEKSVLEAARADLVAQVDPALLEEYEKLRARLGGVAAAEIINNSCSGCHVSYSPPELVELSKNAKDGIGHCEHCGRIVVVGE